MTKFRTIPASWASFAFGTGSGQDRVRLAGDRVLQSGDIAFCISLFGRAGDGVLDLNAELRFVVLHGLLDAGLDLAPEIGSRRRSDIDDLVGLAGLVVVGIIGVVGVVAVVVVALGGSVGRGLGVVVAIACAGSKQEAVR